MQVVDLSWKSGLREITIRMKRTFPRRLAMGKWEITITGMSNLGPMM